MKKLFRYVLVVSVFLMLVACGKPDSQKAFEEKFKEINTLITEKMEDADEGVKKIAELMNKATYKINKVEEKGEDSNLDITIRTINLSKYVNEYMIAATEKFGTDGQSDEKEFNDFSIEYFNNLLKNEKDLEYTETEVSVQMKKIDGKWELVDTDELVLTILGGPVQAVDF